MQRSTTNTESAFMSVKDAARVLGLSAPALREHLRSDHLPSVRLGRRVLVPREALARLERGTTR